MKIKWGNHIPLNYLSDKNGFGYATDRIVNSLRTLGHDVDDTYTGDFDVEIWFDQPHFVQWSSFEAYRVLYFPWESSKLMPKWYPILDTADEIWTPSPLIAQWLHDDGITKPIYVFEHGVDPVWTIKKRIPEDKVKFLNLGFESARKFGPQTTDTFRRAFIDRYDASLTLKRQPNGFNIMDMGKIKSVVNKMNLKELVDLFHEHDAFFYLSAGEGFGLPCLQAAATGMPVITNSDWAPYKHLLDDELYVPSRMDWKDPWQDIHPGTMMRPDFDVAKQRLRDLVNDYEYFHVKAMSRVPEITKQYDWLTLTDEAFKMLEKRL